MISTTKFIRWAAAILSTASLATFSSCAPFPFQASSSGVGAVAGDDGGPAAGAGAAARNESPEKKKGDDTSGEDKPAPPATSGNYPKGHKTQNPFQVISPFEPNNLIDISKNPKTGQPFVSGDLVKDPSNRQIFRIP